MRIDINKNEENALLGRREIVGTIAFEGAVPSRKDVHAAIVAAATHAKPEFLVVKKIATAFGDLTATVTAHAYDSKEKLETLERPHVRKRNGMTVPDKKKAATAEKKE